MVLFELDNYLHRIEDLRRQVGELVAELPEQALNWRPIEGDEEFATNSLAVLAAHVAGAEHFWIGEIVGGRPPTRDRDAEFATQATSAAELVRLLEKVGLVCAGANVPEKCAKGYKDKNESWDLIAWYGFHQGSSIIRLALSTKYVHYTV